MSDDRNNNAANVDDQVLQWVTYRLGDETYGINVMQVQEVLRYTEIAPVPGAPDYVLGIINLRGNVVTVIDTRARFGLPDGRLPATYEQICVTGWVPDDSHPKPLRPGSAKMRLAEALNVPEVPLKD